MTASESLGLALHNHIQRCSTKDQKCTRESCATNRKIRAEYEASKETNAIAD